MPEEALLEQLIELSLADADRQASDRIAKESLLGTEDEILFIRRSGEGSINEVFYIDDNKNPCKLVTLRIHFDGNGQSSPFDTSTLRIYTYRQFGEEFNCQLWRISQRGPHDDDDNDVFFRNDSNAIKDPSPWSVEKGGGFLIRWDAPNTNYKWGIEIGLARTR